MGFTRVPSESMEMRISSPLARVKSLGGPVIGLVVMIVLMSFLSPFFLTSRNLSNIRRRLDLARRAQTHSADSARTQAGGDSDDR